MASSQDLELALSNCDREPVHIPGQIQSFAHLMATDDRIEIMTDLSQNCSDLLDIDPQSLLDQPISQILPQSVVHDLRNLARSGSSIGQRTTLSVSNLWGARRDITVVSGGDRIIFEFESTPIQTQRLFPVARVQSMLGYLSSEMTSEQMLRKAAIILRHSTGFDRVMVYRFLPDGTGEVSHEACAPTLQPYLGLRYPASDIPRSTRDIALKVPVRAIADVTEPPVEIISCRPQQPLDLSFAYSRGVSPIHVEYLTNMGVRASMSLAIVVKGKLWGLFACHHHQPRVLPPEVRTTCELFSQLFGLKFEQVLRAEMLRTRQRTASATRQLLQTPPEQFRFANSAAALGEVILPLLQADGLAVVVRQQVDTVGTTLNPDLILQLIHLCQNQSDVIPLEQLRQLPWPQDVDLGTVAGALVLIISPSEQMYVVVFRQAIATTVRWGGKPEKAVVEGRFGPRLQPRASFDEYLESVQGKAAPWTPTDIETALELRTGLLNLAVSQMDVIQQEAIRQQKQQDLLIAELNHRVKNILALIRSITRQTQESATSIADYVNTLEQRIVALASAHDLVAGLGLEWPHLAELLTIELKPYLAERPDRVKLQGPPVGLKANFTPTLVLVLHELVSNAAKYGALSVPQGQIEVTWRQEDGGLAIAWREMNGPQVQRPSRMGFGRQLIERSLAYEFEGKSRLVFSPKGVQADFWIPNDLVWWQLRRDRLPLQAQVHSSAKTLSASKRVLIVEDNLLIAMDLETMLRSFGLEQIDTAPRSQIALELLETGQYDFGVLDIDLNGSTSIAVAEELLRRQIPFLFTTGYDSKYEMPNSLASIRRLKKPINADQLHQALNEILRIS